VRQRGGIGPLNGADPVRASARHQIDHAVCHHAVCHSAVCHTGQMITEHALLAVIPGREDDFETAFGQARTIIAATPGCLNVSLTRSLESPSKYLLLVQWDRLEDHTEGFRESDQYQQWRQLLHHFYEPFPVVEHFAPVSQTVAANT
jgi:heme-degrading monooxygenase HmoA